MVGVPPDELLDELVVPDVPDDPPELDVLVPDDPPELDVLVPDDPPELDDAPASVEPPGGAEPLGSAPAVIGALDTTPPPTAGTPSSGGGGALPSAGVLPSSAPVGPQAIAAAVAAHAHMKRRRRASMRARHARPGLAPDRSDEPLFPRPRARPSHVAIRRVPARAGATAPCARVG